MKYILYVHKNKVTQEVFYVGIGNTRGRAYDEHSRSKEWYNIVNEHYFDVEIVAKSLPKKLANKMEMALIDVYGLENLTNKTAGGLGTKGLRHTEESKAKIAAGQLGIKRSREAVEKSVQSRRQLKAAYYRHIETGEVIKGLYWACKKHGINYKLEHQRQRRNSANKNFERL